MFASRLAKAVRDRGREARAEQPGFPRDRVTAVQVFLCEWAPAKADCFSFGCGAEDEVLRIESRRDRSRQRRLGGDLRRNQPGSVPGPFENISEMRHIVLWLEVDSGSTGCTSARP